MNVRSSLRRLRDNSLSNALMRLPLASLRRSGVEVPERIFQHLPYKGVFEVPCGGRAFRIRGHGDVVENRVFWRGALGFEPESTGPWQTLVQRAEVVLDIGANTGLYSLIAATTKSGIEVHAFEPVERIADRLEENAKLNTSANITVHRAAVGPEAGTATLFDPGGENCYSASLDPNFLPGASEGGSYEVPVVAIDDLLTSGRLRRVDLIKLDVEGYEAPAIDGMSSVIREWKPSMFVEIARDEFGPLKERLETLLTEGYQMYHLFPAGVRRMERIERSRDSRNVMLIHESRSLEGISVLG